MADLICGENSLRAIIEYHGALICLPECTDEFHDDTCLVGLAKRMGPVLDHLEATRPELCEPMAVTAE